MPRGKSRRGVRGRAGPGAIREPSTAVPGGLDNTLKSVERVAFHNGFDSFIMCNVYAQRATRPKDMERELNPRLHRENLAAFAYALSLSPAPAVWAAWGNIIEERQYLPLCVRDMAEAGRRDGARGDTAGTRAYAQIRSLAEVQYDYFCAGFRLGAQLMLEL